jgi:inner membrane protein
VKWLGDHREGAHCLLAIAVIAALSSSASPYMGGAWFCYAVTVGWASHTFIDMFTMQGVAILYPFTRRKYRLGWMEAGSKWEPRLVLFPTLLVGAWFIAGPTILAVT